LIEKTDSSKPSDAGASNAVLNVARGEGRTISYSGPASVTAGAGLVNGSLDQYKRLIESLTHHAIFELSVDGRITSWNSGAKRTFGYEEHEVLGRDYSMIFSADDIAAGRPQAELRASLELGRESVDGWHVRKNGSRFWCTDTVQPLRDAGGTVTGFTKIVQDSNESHTSSEELRESEERLRLLIEGVTDYAIFSIDPKGNILNWNSGAEHVFGYPEREALGKHFSLIYPAEAIARGLPDAEIADAARDGHTVREGWRVRRGGTLFYGIGELTRLKPDADGKPRGFVKVAHDITLRNQADETNRRQAFHDELTQLPNRAFFSDCLRRAVARAKRHPESRFAVIFIDLDRFKIINDSLGHGAADGLLVHVARALERCVRPEDVVARLGGDEFTILISDLNDTADAVRVADRVQAALLRPFDLDGFEVFTAASMGIAIGSSAYDSAEQVLRDADTAMYEAKERGRAQHVLFDAAMHERAVGLLNLQMDLRRAIAKHEFCVEYQPIVSLEHSRVVGFEALVRWNHPERGVLAPAEFIGEAESTGLIVQIDLWVLGEACRQIRAWQWQYGDPELSVSVNLSSKIFAQDNLVAKVRDALDRNDLTAGSLKLEITETVLIEPLETTSAMVSKVGELGVDLYVDDFGTGYSSLGYLTRFPLKLLKIDRSFVSPMTADPRTSVIARTVITLAHSLGLGALAEGVETDQQLMVLRDLGCEFAQGFLFSKPMAPEIAAKFIGQALPLRADTPAT
jgi:diguanylate cyclase (GGDEF)-like protein/PAS domain S-box-containing protein